MPTFRLVDRDQGGLACDKAGVALGPAELVRSGDLAGDRHAQAVPIETLKSILGAAYGVDDQFDVGRLHRGLMRAATALEAGDICLAGIETVLLGLPDLATVALQKLEDFARFEKWGAGWQHQPRVPAGRRTERKR